MQVNCQRLPELASRNLLASLGCRFGSDQMPLQDFDHGRDFRRAQTPMGGQKPGNISFRVAADQLSVLNEKPVSGE